MATTPVFLPKTSHRQRSLSATVQWVAKSQTQLSDEAQHRNVYNFDILLLNFLKCITHVTRKTNLIQISSSDVIACLLRS